MRTKHQGLVKRLRKTFEACADVHSGRDMTDRLFTRMYCEERNITVLIMVDMSGSTKGWINDPERESLILLAESLQALGDRYAIYGYSGTSVSRTSARIKPGPQPARLETCVRICVEAWKKQGAIPFPPKNGFSAGPALPSALASGKKRHWLALPPTSIARSPIKFPRVNPLCHPRADPD